MKFVAFTLALVGLLLSGCGSSIVVSGTSSSASYDKFQIVADDFANRTPVASLTANAMSIADARKRFALSRGDPFYQFDEGRSYFRTFALPVATGERRLEISSYYSMDFPTTLFVPALLFLDSAGAVIEKRVNPGYTIVNGLVEHLQLSEPVPAKSTFVVIYTTAERVAQRMIFKTYSMTGVVPTPSFTAHDTGLGGHYEGRLKVALAESR